MPGEPPRTGPADGTTPGTTPATTPGTAPGTTPGTTAGTTPGTAPGTTPGTTAGTTPCPAGGPAAPRRALPQHRIERTRTGGLWVAVGAATLVLLLLLIFILQNGQQVRVSFLGAEGRLPLGVSMLLSAVAGALLVVLIGTARIVQLRLIARRHRNVDATSRQS